MNRTRHRSHALHALRRCSLTHWSARSSSDRRPAAGYTPAPGAKDLKASLFNWFWYMGMLRGPNEVEAVATLEHQATGTIQVDGQPCKLAKYRVSTNYQVPGQRIQYTCTRANGQQYSAIEVVSGQYAWNEDIVGAEIVPGKARRRRSRRAARAADSPLGKPAGRAESRDGRRRQDDGVARHGQAVVTYPIPGVPGAIAKATLSASNQAERVEVTVGNVVTEFTYADYRDCNNPLNKIEAFYPGKLVEKRNGVTVRDLTTAETETGNVYVVMPVPPSVRAASK